MRGIILTITAIVGLLLGMLAYQKEQTLCLLDEQGIAVSDLRQQWLVVNYFAEWCTPCLRELPQLDILSQSPEYSHIKVLAVNYDGLPEQPLRELKQRLGFTTSVVTDVEGISQFAPLPQQLPTTYIFTPKGDLHMTLLGEQSATSIAAAIDGER